MMPLSENKEFLYSCDPQARCEFHNQVIPSVTSDKHIQFFGKVNNLLYNSLVVKEERWVTWDA